MAELILGAVSLAIALPTAAQAFGDCGRYFCDRIRTLHSPLLVVARLEKLGYQFYKGKLRSDLESIAAAYADGTIDDGVKQTLEDLFESLRVQFQVAKKALDRIYDDRGEVRRAYLAFLGERKLDKVVSELDRSQSSLDSLLSSILIRRTMVPDNLLLTPSNFRLIAQANREFCTQLSSNPSLWHGRAETLSNPSQEVAVLIERTELSFNSDKNELRKVASLLARQLYPASSRRGILKCLGYRVEPHLELLFLLPSRTTAIKNLAETISSCPVGSNCPYTLDARFWLSRQLAEAVLSVHSLGLVHKNINPETVIMLMSGLSNEGFDRTPDSNLGVPFLTDWKRLRKASDLSSREGGDDWVSNIYRHPRRQGLQPEDRYNMGHDVYSLGVCLLEIGLWQQIVRRDGASLQLSDLYLQTFRSNSSASDDESDFLAVARRTICDPGNACAHRKAATADPRGQYVRQTCRGLSDMSRRRLWRRPKFWS